MLSELFFHHGPRSLGVDEFLYQLRVAEIEDHQLAAAPVGRLWREGGLTILGGYGLSKMGPFTLSYDILWRSMASHMLGE